MYKKNKKIKLRLRKLPVFKVVTVTVLAIAGCLLYLTTHNNQAISNQVIPSTTKQQKSSISDNKGSSESGSTPSIENTQPSTNSTQTSSPAIATSLIAPSGTFVSNHQPNLSGSPRPSQEQSTCNTSPGANCFIEFLGPNGQTKSLKSQVTSSDGSATWTWDVNQAGFTVGEWQITAVASLNGSTKSTTDSLKLNVQP